MQREVHIVRHHRPSESVVQQTLKHQLLDCEHLFLISDCAEPVLEFVCVIDECPQDVIELFHILLLCPFLICC